MNPTTAWRFANLNPDVALFTAAVDDRAALLRAQDPGLSARAAHRAAREQVLLNGHSSVTKLVRVA